MAGAPQALEAVGVRGVGVGVGGGAHRLPASVSGYLPAPDLPPCV